MFAVFSCSDFILFYIKVGKFLQKYQSVGLIKSVLNIVSVVFGWPSIPIDLCKEC